MGANDLKGFVSALRNIHQKLDMKTEAFQQSSGLGCLNTCGKCCMYPEVEASPGEWISLVLDIALGRNTNFGTLEELLSSIQKHSSQTCYMYRFDPQFPEKGSCSAYENRPIICRLFGFATTKNKHSKKELLTCKLIKDKYASYFRKKNNISLDLAPSAAEFSNKIAEIFVSHPTLCQKVHINKALTIALEYVAMLQQYGALSEISMDLFKKTPSANLLPQPPDPR